MKDAITAFLLAFVKQAAQVIIDVALQPDNVEKYKMSYRQIWETGAINAPQSGIADEESEKKISESGIENMPPLPDKW
jgi:hypothetical protein